MDADRKLFEVSGKDRLTFLQGMLSNDVSVLAKGDGIVWAALLTPQGKYLADFFVVAQGEVLLIDIKDQIAEATIRRLSMYRLRAEISFAASLLVIQRGLGETPKGAFADPRHAALGWRSYQTATVQTVPAQGVLSGDDIDWDAIRVAHVIPETGIELIADDSYLLESGFERLHGVDFRKGCYVGQEVTARMKHKTELRKRLVQVHITGSAPVGTPIVTDGKPAGILFTQSHGKAIAYLRFDRTTGLSAGDAQITWVQDAGGDSTA